MNVFFRFLVPGTMLCGEFKYIIHKHLTEMTRAAGGKQKGLSPDQTLYLFANNVPPRPGALMSELYETYKDEDGFLYLNFSAENTLGSYL